MRNETRACPVEPNRGYVRAVPSDTPDIPLIGKALATLRIDQRRKERGGPPILLCVAPRLLSVATKQLAQRPLKTMLHH